MHSYNAGRLTEGIPMVQKFSDFRQILADGYYPKMTTATAKRNIPPRQNDMYWHNLMREDDGLGVTVTDMERWRDRILGAIDRGFVFDVRIDERPADLI